MIVAPTIHQGLSTYTSRKGYIPKEDYNWNLDRLKTFGTLKMAQAVLNVDPKGGFVMDKPYSRKIRKKWNVCLIKLFIKR